MLRSQRGWSIRLLLLSELPAWPWALSPSQASNQHPKHPTCSSCSRTIKICCSGLSSMLTQSRTASRVMVRTCFRLHWPDMIPDDVAWVRQASHSTTIMRRCRCVVPRALLFCVGNMRITRTSHMSLRPGTSYSDVLADGRAGTDAPIAGVGMRSGSPAVKTRTTFRTGSNEQVIVPNVSIHTDVKRKNAYKNFLRHWQVDEWIWDE